MNVIHLVGPDYPASSLFGLRCLRERGIIKGIRHSAFALDSVTAMNAARAAAAPVDALSGWARLAGLFGAAWLAGPALRRHAAQQSDCMLHGWGISAAMACRAVPDRLAVVSLDRAPAERDAARLRTVINERIALITPTQAARRRLGELGINPERVVVIRPPVDLRSINESRNAGRRGRLGVNGGAMVVLTAGPATRGGGQFQAAQAAAIAAQAAPHVRIVTPFDTPERTRIRRFLRAAGFEHLLLNTPPEWAWADFCAAADVMIDAADEESAAEPLAWAMAAGVPIVACAIRSTAELIADRHNGLLSRTGEVHAMARTLLRMLDDADLRRTVADTARGQAYEVFSMREYVDNMAVLYGNVLHGRAPGEGVRDTAIVQ